MPKKGELNYSTELDLDLGTVVPSVAGPKRPQDRIELPKLGHEFVTAFSKPVAENGFGKPSEEFHKTVHVEGGGWTVAGSGGGSQKTDALLKPVTSVET